MRVFSTVGGFVLAAGLAMPALAQSSGGNTFPAPAGGVENKEMARGAVVLASDPPSLVNFFFEQGVPAQLTTDSVGDPLVEFRVNAETYQVFFYDCTDNKDCLSLQFYSGYKTEVPPTLEALNTWNSERRFVRAYRSDDGAARIEMDVATSQDGVTYRDFADLYSLWMERVSQFEDLIGW